MEIKISGPCIIGASRNQRKTQPIEEMQCDHYKV
jgi:hypothetical protein